VNETALSCATPPQAEPLQGLHSGGSQALQPPCDSGTLGDPGTLPDSGNPGYFTACAAAGVSQPPTPQEAHTRAPWPSGSIPSDSTPAPQPSGSIRSYSTDAPWPSGSVPSCSTPAPWPSGSIPSWSSPGPWEASCPEGAAPGAPGVVYGFAQDGIAPPTPQDGESGGSHVILRSKLWRSRPPEPAVRPASPSAADPYAGAPLPKRLKLEPDP
jgi:hypothetical protein